MAKEKILTRSGAEEEQFIAEGTLTYKLTNQINKDQHIALKHELEADISGQEAGTAHALPRFIELVVSGPDERTTYSEDDLKKYVKGINLEIPVTIPPSATIDVGVRRREIISAPGTRIWYMVWVTLSPRITVQSDFPELGFDVQARHPGGSRLQRVIPGKAWLFPGVMFPGQGLDIERQVTRSPRKVPALQGAASDVPDEGTLKQQASVGG